MIDKKLKDFIEDHFDFDGLKAAGFWPKGIKRTDYEKMAERICIFFGYTSVYEYDVPRFIDSSLKTVLVGRNKDKVDENGNFIQGAGFLIGANENEFTCPICECEQLASDHSAYNKNNSPVVIIKCKGFKRKLELYTSLGGELRVTEK